MSYLISVFYFFMLSLISFQVFALDTLLGDEEEGFYLNWPEKEWAFEAEERKETRQTISLLKIQQEPFPERAILTAEPRPEEGFSAFFDFYLENEKKQIPGAEIEILPQSIKGEYDNRLFVLYDRKQEGHSSASVILLIQGQRFLYGVRRKTNSYSSGFIKDSAAFLLKGCILDSKQLLQIRKQRAEVEEEKIKEIKSAEKKAFESDTEELLSLVRDEGIEEKEEPVELTVYKFKKQKKEKNGKSLLEQKAEDFFPQKALNEERTPVGETAITSETEKLSIIWEAAEDWTIFSAPVQKMEKMGEGESVTTKSIKVYHSRENEDDWTETGEMKMSGGPLKEGESADKFLEEYIHKIFQDELKNDLQASLEITEDRLAESDASRIFIIRATKEKVPNIQFYLILFGNKGFYEINRKKRGEEVFFVSRKKFIHFLKKAKLTDSGLTGRDAQKSENEDMDENTEDSEKSDQDDTDSGDGKEGKEDWDSSTDTDTLTDIITDTDTETGTGIETGTKTDTDTITDTETLTDTDTRTGTGTGSGTGTKRDTDTKTDTDTLTDIITDTNTETGTGIETRTKTDTETLTDTDTRTGTGTGSGTGTKRDTDTKTDTDTLTDIITDTNTETGTGTGTSIHTQTRTNTKTGTSTSTSTKIITKTSTATETATNTGTKTSTNTHTRVDTSTKTSTGTSTDITEEESNAMEQQEQQEEADKTNKMFDDQRRTLIKKHLDNILETKEAYEAKSGNNAASSHRNYRINAEEQDWGQARITINDIEKRRKEFNDLMNKSEEEE